MNLTLEEQLQEYWKQVNKAVTKKLIPAHIPVPSHVTDDIMWQRFLDGISHIIDERIYVPQDSLSEQYSLSQLTPEQLRLWTTHWQSIAEHYEQQQGIILPNRDIIDIIYERFAPIKAKLAEQYGGILTKGAALIGVSAILAAGTFTGIAKAFSLDIPSFDFNNNGNDDNYDNGKANPDNNSYQPNNQHILDVEDAYKHEAGPKPKNPKENQQTDNIASIALQPAPSSAYTAQTGDGSGNSAGEKVSEPQPQIATADIPVSLPLRINLGDYPIGQPVTVKLFSTGDDVLTGDAIYTFIQIPVMSGDGLADLLLPAVTGDRIYNLTLQGQPIKNLVTHINKIPYVIAYADGVDPINAGMLERIVLTGDVTQDRRIDSKDLRYIAKNLGSSNPKADLNQDGRVDVDDLSKVAIDFGKQQQIHVQPVPPPQDFNFDLNVTINDMVTGYNLETPENIKLVKVD